MRKLSTAMFTVCVAITTYAVQAASTSTPYLFTSQPTASTGHFQWDEFANVAPDGAVGPHAPDALSFGIGTASFSAPDPSPAFGPVITSTQNIYAGSELIDFEIDLSGLSDADPSTTVILQVGAAGTLDGFLLDGMAPTSLVDRGTADVTSMRADGSTSTQSVQHYWVAWDAAAATDYDITFANTSTHTSLTHARVEYYNSATALQAIPAGNVPEPTTAVLASLAGCVLMASRRRRS